MISEGQKGQGIKMGGRQGWQRGYRRALSSELLCCKKRLWLFYYNCAPGGPLAITMDLLGYVVPFAERSGLPVDHHGCHICL